MQVILRPCSTIHVKHLKVVIAEPGKILVQNTIVVVHADWTIFQYFYIPTYILIVHSYIYEQHMKHNV
ncbi:hypothetical protein IMPR6_170001 [Imperialibacter sp. EC-SDR9]|nr:hypothetical protein IMPR6_170001 [Imperialibacter sp. EC-SDR9]